MPRALPTFSCARSRSPRVAVVAAVAGLVLVGCSSEGGSSSSETVPVVTEPAASVDEPAATAPVDASSDTSEAPATTDAGATASTPPTVPPTVPEVGVPGLDSEEVVCRAWSRFGGSFQVVAVAWSFSDPAIAAALEVAAAPVVVDAVEELLANWPEELAAEREAVADGFVGPTARRADSVVAELEAAGATEGDLAALAEAWLAALAVRDPADPVLAVDLTPELDSLVTAAAEAVVAALPPVPQDPSLVVEVEIPATEAYLAGCPDQGALAGTEVG